MRLKEIFQFMGGTILIMLLITLLIQVFILFKLSNQQEYIIMSLKKQSYIRRDLDELEKKLDNLENVTRNKLEKITPCEVQFFKTDEDCNPKLPRIPD